MCPVSLEVPGLQSDIMVEQGLFLYEKFNQVAGNVEEIGVLGDSDDETRVPLVGRWDG